MGEYGRNHWYWPDSRSEEIQDAQYVTRRFALSEIADDENGVSAGNCILLSMAPPEMSVRAYL
jgi:hypothetical protein